MGERGIGTPILMRWGLKGEDAIRPLSFSEPGFAGFANGRGGRVVEGARLERVCAGNRTVGSNPTLSAV